MGNGRGKFKSNIRDNLAAILKFSYPLFLKRLLKNCLTYLSLITIDETMRKPFSLSEGELFSFFFVRNLIPRNSQSSDFYNTNRGWILKI